MPVSGWVVAHIPVAVSDLYPIAVRNKAHIESNCRHATSVHVAELSQRARCEHCTAGHTATLVHHTVRAVTIARESAGRSPASNHRQRLSRRQHPAVRASQAPHHARARRRECLVRLARDVLVRLCDARSAKQLTPQSPQSRTHDPFPGWRIPSSLERSLIQSAAPCSPLVRRNFIAS